MLSNDTREALMTKFGVDIGITQEDGGDNVIDFTNSKMETNINQEKYLSFIADTLFEEKQEKDDNKKYTYNGITNLNSSDPSVVKGETVYICNYNINIDAVNPFLIFNLYKNNKNIIEFPSFIYEKGSLIKKIKKNIENQFDNYDVDVNYKGYIRFNNIVFVWFENKYKKKIIKKGNHNDKYWEVLISEILNEKKVLNYDIDNNVINFFLENSDFIFLNNTSGKLIEIPKVQYYGNYYKRILYAAAIGHEREMPGGSLGPYFYFGSYLRAIRYALWTSSSKPLKIDNELITINDKGLYKKGGLVRFVIFTGKHTMLMGRKNDKKDVVGEQTEYKIKRANLRDEGGKWVDEYDSIGQGIYEVDGKIYYPQLAVKKYEQQYPLSYYYIDTKQAEDNIDLENIIVE